MKKPLIGILPLYDEHRDSYWMLPAYMKAIEKAGGLPLMLPLTDNVALLKQITETFDGFLFTGGHDIDPKLYGQARSSACGTIITERDEMESELFRLAFRLELPMLGICRGLQLFNALLGGTLYQDLPSQHPSDLLHVQKPPYANPVHEVKVNTKSKLFGILNESSLMVNSYHHQGICQLAPACHAAAVASDGIIEAIEHHDYRYLLAIQWHPEFMFKTDEASSKIFSSFVQAANH